MRDQLYLSLDLLGSLPSASLNGVSEQVMGGIVNLIGTHEGLVRYDHPSRLNARTLTSL
jgi:brefeldin A-resistance guanine nucleotide exchange factor 1